MNQDKLEELKERIILHRLLGISVGALAVFLMAFTLIPTLISEAHAAEDISASVSWQAIQLTLDPHGDINFYDVIPSRRDTASGNYGTQKVIKKQIDVTTEGNYYAVYLSTVGDDNSLKVSGNDSARAIPATSNSVATGFAQSSWGYAIPTTETATTFSSYDTFLADAGSDTTANNLTKTGTGSNVYNTGKWYGVPELTNATQIYKNSTNAVAGFSSGDSFNVYYSIMVDTDVLSGTYENQVVYTAIASTTSLDELSENVMRDKDTALSMVNETETLEIDLAATSSALATSDIKVYLVPHNIITTNSYDISTLTSTDYPECLTENVDTAGITDSGISATITCTLPPLESTGTTSSAYAIEQGGEYDFWVQVRTPDRQSTVNYLSHYRTPTSEIASITYSTGIGLQTVHAIDGNPTTTEAYVKTMQEMTPTICSNTNQWGTGVLTYDSTTLAANGNDARVYDYTGTGTPLASTANASAAIGLGTFLLGDTRETVTSGGQAGTNYKTYLVRRLADGNCWMVQNLDLNLADFTSGKSKRLTSDNTNLNTKNIWIPDASMTAAKTTLEPGPSGGLSDPAVSSYQFQQRNTFGPNLFWGSRYQAGTTTDNTGTANNNGLVIDNNANSSFARSYNNDLAYLTGTQNVKNVAECAKITDAAANWSAYCQQNGQIGNAGGSLTSATSSDGTTQDTTWQPSAITSDTDTTFTMRGSNYLGDYYNWYAATAESGTWNTTSGNMQDDICPKGWRLPTSSGKGSWDDLIKTTYQLTSSYGYTANNRKQLNKLMQLPFSIPFAGFYVWTNGALESRGSNGRYWSSTAVSNADAHTLGLNHGGNVNAQHSGDKVYGFAVRCVARD